MTREPLIDSPFWHGLWYGRPATVYRGRVRAVTPDGITVTGWCCRRGHMSPQAADRHAQGMAARIAETGR